MNGLVSVIHSFTYVAKGGEMLFPRSRFEGRGIPCGLLYVVFLVLQTFGNLSCLIGFVQEHTTWQRAVMKARVECDMLGWAIEGDPSSSPEAANLEYLDDSIQVCLRLVWAVVLVH